MRVGVRSQWRGNLGKAWEETTVQGLQLEDGCGRRPKPRLLPGVGEAIAGQAPAGGALFGGGAGGGAAGVSADHVALVALSIAHGAQRGRVGTALSRVPAGSRRLLYRARRREGHSDAGAAVQEPHPAGARRQGQRVRQRDQLHCRAQVARHGGAAWRPPLLAAQHAQRRRAHRGGVAGHGRGVDRASAAADQLGRAAAGAVVGSAGGVGHRHAHRRPG
eukprot:ctg_5160.g510